MNPVAGAQTASSPLVSVEAVHKSFYRDTIEIKVLLGIDLTIAQGEFLALMGPSGSGKTTLLNLVAGIDHPTSGRIVVAAHEITGMGEDDLARWRARNVGFIFQLYNLLPVLTAFENVELPLLLTRLGKEERRRHVMTALDLVGLTDRARHYPRQLSGGQEQRVGIARAIVTDPTVIVADEPTGDLDARSADEILTLLTDLNKQLGKTIIMVTHDMKAAQRAHSIRYLDKGVLRG